MKKRILWTLSMLIVTALLMTCLTATAETTNDGKIVITIGNESSVFERNGIELKLYLVARGDYGSWTNLEAYSNIRIAANPAEDSSKWIQDSMDKIKAAIQKSGVGATMTVETDKTGMAEFDGLEHGIYYVTLGRYKDVNLQMSPMLLAVPNKADSLIVTAKAKAGYKDVPEGTTIRKLIVPTKGRERLVNIDEYETALGLGNIQMHVGVCFE